MRALAEVLAAAERVLIVFGESRFGHDSDVVALAEFAQSVLTASDDVVRDYFTVEGLPHGNEKLAPGTVIAGCVGSVMPLSIGEARAYAAAILRAAEAAESRAAGGGV